MGRDRALFRAGTGRPLLSRPTRAWPRRHPRFNPGETGTRPNNPSSDQLRGIDLRQPGAQQTTI
jgi:hypothetical protein